MAQSDTTASDTTNKTHDALKINIGFNGPDDQFPYADQFYTFTNSFYQSIGRKSMPGDRHCHAYLSWDIAQQAQGSGPITTEGSRSWFENWLSTAQGHCDEALVTFKNVDGVTMTTSLPTADQYRAAVKAFLDTDWSYTGWTNRFAYTAWNEPNNGAGSGDGYTQAIPARQAADFYLVLRRECGLRHCHVAAGDFGSNGDLWQDFVQHCHDDVAGALCSDASYMDAYKHYLADDAGALGLAADFRPEIFSYHDWDDINNYINSQSHCRDGEHCTTHALLNALSGGGWERARIWDTEVGAGQDPESNPDATTQACAASYLLRLSVRWTDRIERIYYTRPYDSTGEYWSLFTSTGAVKPAFTVLGTRNIAYTPPSGSTCP